MSFELSILQYNTHLFKGSPGGSIVPGIVYEDDLRTDQIIERIRNSEADLVSLVEVWSNERKNRIAEELKDLYFFFKVDQSGGPQGAGLLLLSKFEIPFVPGIQPFTKFRNLTGADALSQKGFLVMRLVVQRSPEFMYVWCIVTHTQADYDRQAVNCRRDNLEQIRAQVRKLNDDYQGEPVILIGDLNVIGEGAEYAEMKRLFQSVKLSDSFRRVYGDPSAEPGYTYDGIKNQLIWRFAPDDRDKQQRLDYVFVSDRLQPRGASVVKDFKYHDSKSQGSEDLSDHYPLHVREMVDLP